MKVPEWFNACIEKNKDVDGKIYGITFTEEDTVGQQDVFLIKDPGNPYFCAGDSLMVKIGKDG